MGKCVNHPDRETHFVCLKHNVYMCCDCLHCRDPKIHCKFRSSCPIWFMEKRGGDHIDEIPASKQQRSYQVFFKPDAKNISVAEGTTPLEAAIAADSLSFDQGR